MDDCCTGTSPLSVSGGVQTLADRIDAEVAAFGQDPARARKALRDLHAANPPAFGLAALPLLREGNGRTGLQFLYEMLKDVLPFCDPSLLSLEDDVAIARVVMQREPLLDVKLARRITNSKLRGGEGIDDAIALRILEVLAAIADGTRILPMLIQVLREPDPRLRSKAALLAGRTSKNVQWVEQALREPDARLRRPRSVDWLAFGVALPATHTGSRENCAVLERGAQACLALKGSADRWAILRFGTPVEAADHKTLPPACFLRPDVDALTAALNAPQEQFPFADVVPDLLRAVTQASGSRNLLLLADCTDGSALPELDAARWEGLVRDAQATAVAIHAVTLIDPGGSPGILADVSERTGGMCLATSKPDRILELCGKLYSSLLHPYEIL
ncbi:MAG: HEAT repeat domain-containing protein [Bryobacteraceae bacterium]